jgi:hypothetical protein
VPALWVLNHGSLQVCNVFSAMLTIVLACNAAALCLLQCCPQSSHVHTNAVLGGCCRLIAWLYQCMSVPQAVPAVAVAMRHLCEDCGPHMAACLPGLIDLYKQALTGGAASSRQQGSSGSSSTGLHPAQAAGAHLGGPPPAAGLELEEEDVQMVIEGVVTVVCR